MHRKLGEGARLCPFGKGSWVPIATVFVPCLLWPNGWMDAPLGTMVGLGPCNIVLDANPAPPQGVQPPQISAHVCCRQMAGWIKMPLGMKVGLRPGRIALHMGTQLPVLKGTRSPIFALCLLWRNGRPSQLLLSTLQTVAQNMGHPTTAHFSTMSQKTSHLYNLVKFLHS